MDQFDSQQGTQLRSVIVRLISQYKKVFFVLLAVSLFQSLLTGSTILLIAPITEMILQPGEGPSSKLLSIFLMAGELIRIKLEIYHLFFIFGTLMLAAGFTSVLTRYAVLHIKFLVLVDLLSRTMGRFLSARYTFFSTGEVGKLLNSFQREIEKLGDTLGLLVGTAVAALQVLIYLSIPAVLFPRLTAEFVIFGAALSSPLWLLRKWSYRFGHQSTNTANLVAKVLHENLTSAKLILGFGKQYSALHNYTKQLKYHAQAAVKFGTLTAGVNLLFVPVGTIAALIVVYRGLGDAYSLTGLATALFAFFRAVPLVATIIQAKASIDGFGPAFRQVEELQGKAETLREKTGGKIFSNLKEGIDLKNIRVEYPGGGVALEDVSFFIPKGKMTAIVGRSGSGKTTIADLLLGLILPTQGEILLDGEPFSRYDIQSFRERIGFVPQEEFLFNMTIRENLVWAKPGATDYQLRHACDTAHASEFIDILPGGLDYVIGDRGSRLSGGQRQRLTLARALIKEPEILILDEPTSALDNNSQEQVSAALDDIMQEKTILMIAHRPETIRKSDQVIVMEKGRVIESGSHNELAKRMSGYFS
jgi:ABC-type multidrug transport system fused ATPase/permease subunit